MYERAPMATQPEQVAETTSPVDHGINAAGKTAGLVVDYGMLTMCGVAALFFMGAVGWLMFRYFNQRISGDYVHKDNVVDYFKENHSNLMRKNTEDRPSLLVHRIFTISTTIIRRAEAADTSDAVRDLTVWTLRAYRDAFLDLIEDAYKHKDGFDAFWPTPEIFKSKVANLITEIDAAIRCRLVDEFSFPISYYNAWITFRSDHDKLMEDMLDLASDRETPYDRVLSMLDSLFAKASSFQRMVGNFATIYKAPTEYKTPAAADDMVTHQRGFAAAGRVRPPSALFDKRRG